MCWELSDVNCLAWCYKNLRAPINIYHSLFFPGHTVQYLLLSRRLVWGSDQVLIASFSLDECHWPLPCFSPLFLPLCSPKDIVLWVSYSTWHILMILSCSCSCWCQTHLWLHPPWRLHIDLTESQSYSLGLDFSVSFCLLKWDVLDSKPRGCWSRALCDSFIFFFSFLFSLQ